METNELLFEWRATDHFSFADCHNIPLGISGSKENSFDYFHINSIDKEPKRDFIISARYSHAVTYIDGTDGHIIWRLGGKNNSLPTYPMARPLSSLLSTMPVGIITTLPSPFSTTILTLVIITSLPEGSTWPSIPME